MVYVHLPEGDPAPPRILAALMPRLRHDTDPELAGGRLGRVLNTQAFRSVPWTRA
jgi:hypothetical protein